MRKLLKYPHYIFLLAGPLILLIGVFNPEKSLHLNVYDTYYIFFLRDLTYLISLIFLITGFGYWMMKKMKRKLSNRMNIIHIILTFGGIILIWILSKFYRDQVQSQLYRDQLQEFKFNNNLTLTIYITINLVIMGQLLFPINIIRGLIIKPETSTKNT